MENKEVCHNFCLWRKGREWIIGENLLSLLPDTIVTKHWSRTAVSTIVCVNPWKYFEKWGLSMHIFKLKSKIFHFRLNNRKGYNYQWTETHLTTTIIYLFKCASEIWMSQWLIPTINLNNTWRTSHCILLDWYTIT